MRTALCAIYEESGTLPRDIEYMINNLRTEVNYLIIIINGVLENKEAIEEQADSLVVRENRGFDAGAFKDAFFRPEVRAVIDQSDELVFCNNTFYGPFISFSELFDKMSSSKADFWGLNYSDNGVLHFIQSYFLVFRRKILQHNMLDSFFKENIDENTTDITDALINFERGLFQYLVRKNYKFDYIWKQTYHVLGACDGSVCYDKLPLLKKKAFSEEYFNKNRMLNCLKYININYDYDVTMILEDIYNRYSIEIQMEEVRQHRDNIMSNKLEREKISREDILHFCNKYSKVYIYGAGTSYLKIKYVLGFIDRDVIAGFIVSDGKRTKDFFEGKKIYEISEMKVNLDAPIIVAMNVRNTHEVKQYLTPFRNVLMWE